MQENSTGLENCNLMQMGNCYFLKISWGAFSMPSEGFDEFLINSTIETDPWLNFFCTSDTFGIETGETWKPF